MKREQLMRDLEELTAIMNSLPYGTEIWNTAREAVETTRQALEPVDVKVLPECASFERFEADTEIWIGHSGVAYRIS